jgi:uncharacterized protein
MNLPITAWTLAVLCLLLTALSLNISRLRVRYRVSFGDGGHKDLLAATRLHGNALEQSLLFVVLLLAQEALAAPRAWLLTLALVFVVARGTHALAGYARVLLPRQIAHAVSVLAQVASAIQILRTVGWP